MKYRYGSAYVGRHVQLDPLVARAGDRQEITNRIVQGCVHELVQRLVETDKVMISEGPYDVSVEMVVITAEEIDMLYKALMSSREAAAHAMREIFGDWPAIPGEIRFPENKIMLDDYGEGY